ncbi:MAG: DUF948 domain-containing protein [Armatimonadota bacterium]|jgi:myo-inositol-1-phosphate synthase|nr:DUF948 domain-containing protein [Armatimonadota bacterium]
MHTWAEIALVLIAIGSIANVLILAVLLVSVIGAYRQLRGLAEKAQPLMKEAEEVLAAAKQTVATVGDRAEKVSGEVVAKAQHIADLSERVAERVAQRVDTTSAIVQEAVCSPAIHLASLRAGVGKGLEVWQELSKTKERNNGK